MNVEELEREGGEAYNDLKSLVFIFDEYGKLTRSLDALSRRGQGFKDKIAGLKGIKAVLEDFGKSVKNKAATLGNETTRKIRSILTTQSYEALASDIEEMVSAIEANDTEEIEHKIEIDSDIDKLLALIKEKKKQQIKDKIQIASLRKSVTQANITLELKIKLEVEYEDLRGVIIEDKGLGDVKLKAAVVLDPEASKKEIHEALRIGNFKEAFEKAGQLDEYFKQQCDKIEEAKSGTEHKDDDIRKVDAFVFFFNILGEINRITNAIGFEVDAELGPKLAYQIIQKYITTRADSKGVVQAIIREFISKFGEEEPSQEIKDIFYDAAHYLTKDESETFPDWTQGKQGLKSKLVKAFDKVREIESRKLPSYTRITNISDKEFQNKCALLLFYTDNGQLIKGLLELRLLLENEKNNRIPTLEQFENLRAMGKTNPIQDIQKKAAQLGGSLATLRENATELGKKFSALEEAEKSELEELLKLLGSQEKVLTALLEAKLGELVGRATTLGISLSASIEKDKSKEVKELLEVLGSEGKKLTDLIGEKLGDVVENDETEQKKKLLQALGLQEEFLTAFDRKIEDRGELTEPKTDITEAYSSPSRAHASKAAATGAVRAPLLSTANPPWLVEASNKSPNFGNPRLNLELAQETDAQGCNFLHELCKNKKIETQTFIKCINELAVKFESEEKFKALLNQANKEGNTPLHLLCENSHFKGEELAKILKLLSDNGAELAKVNNAGCTPLHMLCTREESEQAIQVFHEWDADINIAPEVKGKSNFTPIYLAFIKGNHEAVKVLNSLKAKTNIEQTINEGIASTLDGYLKSIGISTLDDAEEERKNQEERYGGISSYQAYKEYRDSLGDKKALVSKEEVLKIACQGQNLNQDFINKLLDDMLDEVDIKKLPEVATNYAASSASIILGILSGSLTLGILQDGGKNTLSTNVATGLSAGAMVTAVVGGAIWGAGRLANECYNQMTKFRDASIGRNFATNLRELYTAEKSANLDQWKGILQAKDKEIVAECSKMSPDLNKLAKEVAKQNILRKTIFETVKEDNKEKIQQASNNLLESYNKWAEIQKGREVSEGFKMLFNIIKATLAPAIVGFAAEVFSKIPAVTALLVAGGLVYQNSEKLKSFVSKTQDQGAQVRER